MKALLLIVGIAAAIGTTGAWLPQVAKTWKSRRAHDFSWAFLAMFGTGVALWLVYGILRDDPAIIGANAVTLVLVLSIVAIKSRE